MQKEFYGSRSEFNFQLMIRFRHDVLHKLRYLFFFWMFIHVENEYACCKKTCLPSFLKLMDGVFLQEIGVPSLDRAGAQSKYPVLH